MENIWAYMKKQLDEYEGEPRDQDELWDRVQKIWTNIPIDFIHDLYQDIPKRIKKLYQNKGGYI